MRGLVIKSSRNIFTVKAENTAESKNTSAARYECRLKGKVLKGAGTYYNPLAPGDVVDFEVVDFGQDRYDGKGLITGVATRRNFFTRYNRKGQLPQILAANIDAIVCVTTPDEPPFRPRFIDRVLAQAEGAGIRAVIVLNKTDLRRDSDEDEIEQRLADFERIGYLTLRVSARMRTGLAAFHAALNGKLAALAGQSGVGKSSLLNALHPAAALKTGAINSKYGRGTHSTVQSVLYEFEDNLRIIDTPGVRQFVPHGIDAQNLIFAMPEFAPYAGACAYGLSCSHSAEPACAVRKAVEDGAIHPGRYESYLRMRADLAQERT